MELTAVLIVMIILAGTAAVSLTSTTGSRSASAARQLLHDMTFARQRAVATGTASWMEFNGQTWTVRVEDPAVATRASAEILIDPATNDEFTETMNAGRFIGVTISSVDFDTEDWVGFDWLGRPMGKSSEAIPLTADGAVIFTGGEQVNVDKDTGHVVFVPAP